MNFKYKMFFSVGPLFFVDVTSSTHTQILNHVSPFITIIFCHNPTLAKCGGEAQHLEKLEVGSLPGLPNVQSSTSRGKTPRIGVFLVSLKRS
jgi:hypothetical protein